MEIEARTGLEEEDQSLTSDAGTKNGAAGTPNKRRKQTGEQEEGRKVIGISHFIIGLESTKARKAAQTSH